MTWSVKAFENGQSTPIFVDLLDTCDEAVICVEGVATAFGQREYRLAFEVPESAARDEIDRLSQHGAVFIATADLEEA